MPQIYLPSDNSEHGPAERYRYRNTLGDPWPDPAKIDYRLLPEVRPHFVVRAWRAVIDTLTGAR